MIRIFVDTNILISAILKPQSDVAMAYYKALLVGDVFVSKNVLNELSYVVNKKFPKMLNEYQQFLIGLEEGVTVINGPLKIDVLENKIRDEKDRPILRAALSVDADIFLTGDKDFLEADIERPLIMSPAEFLQYSDIPPDDPLKVADGGNKYNK
ncbi:MAG: putative toxin-antitoxin system toxin component, PIN family [Phascolarctobacterium sp.]|nr:putative toxin-antitoxin system toxin component, PIN family [Candidatus Phascolarctobacterium caballi]